MPDAMLSIGSYVKGTHAATKEEISMVDSRSNNTRVTPRLICLQRSMLLARVI